MLLIVGLLGVGLLGGAVSGLVGLGGGSIIVPLLVYGFGLSQHMAQGTSLALMLPPIGVFAVMTYYQQGNINIKFAIIIMIGFLLGALVGAWGAHLIPQLLLRRIFGVFLVIVGVKMIL